MTPGARSPSGSGRSSTASAGWAATTSLFRLEANHWNGTVAPQLVVRRVLDAPERYESLRDWLADQWRLPAAERSPDAAAIFTELGLDAETSVKRPLLESEAFRALVEEPELAQAA